MAGFHRFPRWYVEGVFMLPVNSHAHAGITTFLIVRMWFGKGVEDFNKSIKMMTDQPKVKADNGNGFTSKCLRAQYLSH